MPDWVLPILLGIIAASGTYLTVAATRKQGDRERIRQLEIRLDKVDARDSRKSDYIEDLRDQVGQLGGKPIPYPDNLFE